MPPRFPDARRIHTLEKAALMYEGLANDTYRILAQGKYRWLEPDLAVLRDHAAVLREMLAELQGRAREATQDQRGLER